MVSFCAISDKLSELMSSASKGCNQEHDDAFEVMYFQIHQWRKRVLPDQDLKDLLSQSSWSLKKRPAWIIILYLRANSIHGMILRSYFLSNSNGISTRRNFEPALAMVSDTIELLYALDQSTDEYRKLHPHFQHVLASACAVLCLIVANLDQYSFDSTAFNSDKLYDSISRNFKKALTLTATYRDTFGASRRLWKRLVSMKQPLRRIGIISEQSQPSASGFSASQKNASITSGANAMTGSVEITQNPPDWDSNDHPLLEFCNFPQDQIEDLPPMNGEDLGLDSMFFSIFNESVNTSAALF